MKSVLIIYLIILQTVLSAQQKYRIFINEFLASNVSVNADIVDFDDYSDWIELYNDEDFDVNLGGYFITDNLNRPTRYQFPADVVIPSKGFLLLWADGHNDIPGKTYQRDYFPYEYYTTKYFHLNFSISRASEELALFNADTLLIDSVEFNLQERDVSMGRKPDGNSNWNYFGDPTPGAGNNTNGVQQIIYSADPVVSLSGGFYSGTQAITITSGTSNYEVRYTLDGSRPSQSSALYAGPIEISKTTVLRIRVYESGKLPGKIHTFTYFIDEPSDLAVISLTAFPETMWDKEIGIYNNQFKSREIPVTLEYFEELDRSKGFTIDAGLRMTGQASLDYPQKSFTIETDSKYGKDVIDYSIFPERKLNSFTELYLRNAGVPDNRLTMFRDAFLQSLVMNKIDIDCQAYKPSALFINGNYWGIYNIREKIGPAYLASLNNINPDDIDLLEINKNKFPEVVEGSADEFIELLNFFEQNDLTAAENYEYIKSKVDIDEYINYYITEIYYDNIFWLNQNVRIWKERKEGSKWRWILFDTDNAFGAEGPGTSRYQTNTLQLVTSSTENNVYPLWSTLTFRKLIANDEFRVKFVQNFSSYLKNVFHPDSALRVLTQFQNKISEEMKRHIPRWNTGGIINGLPPITNHFEWINNVTKMRLYAANRPAFQRQHIISTFNLPGITSITVNADSFTSGKIVINDIETINSERTGIYFRNIPVILHAVPEVGFRFVKWTGIDDEYQNPVTVIPQIDSMYIAAEFEPVEVNIIPSIINNNLTLTKTSSPYYAKSDVIIAGNTTLTIEAGVSILMPEGSSVVVNGKLSIEGSKDEPVIIEPNENSQRWGALCFVNAADSSIVKYLLLRKATKGVDYSRDKGALSSFNSNLYIEGLSVEQVEAPVFVQYGNIIIKNSKLYTEYSGDLINIKKANYALTENCDLMGNDAFDSDAIDYDQIKSGIIRGNKIYNIYGFNSDGIDLGEDSRNILIENNMIFNVADKGISIGNTSTGTIKRNIIANCDQGIGIKDFGSYGYIENNTFYGNNYAIACFEKNIGEGGGNADAVNCIFANSKTSSVYVDNLSNLNISFSLSNTDKLDGVQNIKADPLLLNDLYPAFGSPAINSGNPSLPYDPDGTIADMGAHSFDQFRQTNLIINEIHYNPADGNDYGFVEIVNAGKTTVNLNNYSISGDINYKFGDEIIASGEFIVAAKNKSLYEGNGYKVYQWESGELNKAGSLQLINNKGESVDFVNYNSKFFWAKEPDGKGPSLELQNTSLENMVSHSWRSSFVNGGTPGRSNNSKQITNIFVNEFLSSNDQQFADENGDYDDWIELYNNNGNPINISGLYITDDFSNPIKYQIPFHSAEQTTIPAKGHLLIWADEQGSQGLLHANFKLDKAGEQIGIVQVVDSDTLFIDSLTYAEQSTNVSYGRMPDGSENWSYFNIPTPLDSNKVITDVPGDEIIPVYALEQNYPNPFNPVTIIKWQLAIAGNVSLKVYDILGKEVTSLVNEYRPAGKYETEFRSDSFASGVYIYQLRSGSFVQTRKMILLR